jgi:hypothetical protein
MNTEITTTATPKFNAFKSLVTESLQRTANRNLMNVWYTDGLAQLYMLRIRHYKGKKKELYDEFLKLGYSTQYDITSRLSYLPSCFKVEVLQTVIFEKDEAYHTEQLLHKGLRQWKYTPRHNFSGSTECYRPDLLTEYCDLNQMIDAVTHPEPAISTPYSLN